MAKKLFEVRERESFATVAAYKVVKVGPYKDAQNSQQVRDQGSWRNGKICWKQGSRWMVENVHK